MATLARRMAGVTALVVAVYGCTGHDTPAPDGGQSTGDNSSGDGRSRDGGLQSDSVSWSDGHAAGDIGPPAVAVPGSRCNLTDRVGLVELRRYESGPLYLTAELTDKPFPGFGDFAFTDASCGFHQAGFCGLCPPTQMCGHDGTCTAPQKRVDDVRLTLSAGDQQQIFLPHPKSGAVQGPVTLPGTTFSLVLAWPGYGVTLVQTTVPEPLSDLQATLSGTLDAPTAMDITWTSPPDGGQVYVLVPINHHAGGPTFTECTVDASAGALHIDGAMLQPLAVETGLEFQSVDHVRFAAAQTAVGCIELRFMVHQSP